MIVGVPAIENLARGQRQDLPPEVKQALARETFGADFDQEVDRLRSIPRPPARLLGIRPPSVSEMEPAVAGLCATWAAAAVKACTTAAAREGTSTCPE